VATDEKPSKLKQVIEDHPMRLIGGVAVAAIAATWTFFAVLNSKDAAELERYRALDASPEQIKGRLEAKGAEICGARKIRIAIADFGKEGSFTCAETTFTYVAERVKDLPQSCGAAAAGILENVQPYPIALRIRARNERGARSDCVVAATMGTNYKLDG